MQLRARHPVNDNDGRKTNLQQLGRDCNALLETIMDFISTGYQYILQYQLFNAYFRKTKLILTAMESMIDGSMIIILTRRIRCTKVPIFRILLAKVEQVFHGFIVASSMGVTFIGVNLC